MSYADPYHAQPPRSTLQAWLPWLVVLLSFVLMVQSWRSGNWFREVSRAEPRPIAPRGNLGDDEQAVIKLFNQSSRSVVCINTSKVSRDFFFNSLEVPEGTGSGFVWDEAGHIVTNFHVIRGASRVRVTLGDQSTWNAKFVGGSPERDVAVLLVDAPRERLTPLLVGESHNLQVGQRVFAIGNPFGLDQTLTTGIVSGLGRRLRGEQGVLEDLIQTDAPINPGNSGGPLLDSAGRLIGVNTAIYSPSGASAGVGFAIPVDDVQRVVPELIKNGRVLQASLNARFVPDRIAGQLGIEGVMIAEVEADGAAAKAGLRGLDRDELGNIQLGDIILAVEQRPITNVRELFAALRRFEVGKTVKLTILRNFRSDKPEHFEVPVTLSASQ